MGRGPLGLKSRCGYRSQQNKRKQKAVGLKCAIVHNQNEEVLSPIREFESMAVKMTNENETLFAVHHLEK